MEKPMNDPFCGILRPWIAAEELETWISNCVMRPEGTGGGVRTVGS